MKNRYVLLVTGFLLIIFVLIIKYVNNDISEELLVSDNTVLALDNNKKTPAVVVKVFYEVLCPDSKHFINKQLAPAWNSLVKNNATHLVNFQLIPYGKAVTSSQGNGVYTFQCQHGVPECILNKIHGCTISNKALTFSKKLEMVQCSITNPKESTEKCGLSECASGDDLLRQYGIMTNALNPKIQFVPTITINDSQERQSELLKNFYGVLIEHLNVI